MEDTSTTSGFSLKEDLANTLLSKLDINSKFLGTIVDKALATVSNKIELNDKNINAKIDKLSTNKTKTKETNPNTDKKEVNKTAVKESTQIPVYKQSSTDKLLNVTNNTFKILTTPDKDLNLKTNIETEPKSVEQKNSNSASFVNKFTKALEKTTSKLEEIVKKVPRPWELTPGTSIGYQMLKGEDDAMSERIRKGLAQFMGRYATNIQRPYGYKIDTENLNLNGLKSILKDKAAYENSTVIRAFPSSTTDPRETLYREMFDLPSRAKNSQFLEKIAPKEYTFKKDSGIKGPQPLEADLEGPLTQQAVSSGILGSVILTPTEKGNYSYKDPWDIISPGDTQNKYGLSSSLRKLIAPLLRPATVSGKVDRQGNLISFGDEEPDNRKEKTTSNSKLLTSPINLTKDITKEVSNKIEQMPIINSLTKGFEDLKNNKMIDGLKEVSKIAPSLNPVISFLSSKTEPIIETTNTTSLTEPLLKFQDQLKETTTSKLTEWTDDLENWSQKEIENFKNSFGDILDGTEKIKNIIPSNNLEAKPLIKNITSESTPILTNNINPDTFSINNTTLNKIASNTERTNNAIKALGEAVFKLAQNVNGGKSNIIIPPSPAPQSNTQEFPPVSTIAASNQDPIAAVRSDFVYNLG
jgi:hypothetical protein